jgi:hypothetical protein
MSKLQQTNIELPIKYSGYGVMDFRSLLGQRRGYVFREKFVKSPPPPPQKQSLVKERICL